MAGLLDPQAALIAQLMKNSTAIDPLYSDPNNVGGTYGMDPYSAGRNINWGALPGYEQFYSYDQNANQERADPKAIADYLAANGMSWQQGSSDGKTGQWIVGPDGQPIVESARFGNNNDDRFKLAALAAMGVTGANILAAGGGLGGIGAAQGGVPGGGYMDAAAINEAATANLGADWGAAAGGTSGLPAYAVDPYGGAVSGLPSYAVDPYGIDYSMSQLPGVSLPGAQPSSAPPSAPSVTPKPPPAGGGLLNGLLEDGSGDLIKAGIIGAGAIAGSQESGGDTVTRQSKTDPRMDPYIYGDGGILKELQSWYGANKAPNANMQAGWDQQLGLLKDPAIAQQMASMRNQAFQGSQAPVAGNPFSDGRMSLQMPQWAPRRGLLGG